MEDTERFDPCLTRARRALGSATQSSDRVFRVLGVQDVVAVE